MSDTVNVKVDGEPVEVSPTAQELVRVSFNPSQLPDVKKLKSLSSAFISECERIQKADPATGRSMAVAITNMQTASMWAVLGATTGK